jgi:hypothetical protein
VSAPQPARQPFPFQRDDLAHLRRQLALLAANVEQAAASGESTQRSSLQHLGEYANAVLHQVTLAEQACVDCDANDATVAKLQDHFRAARSRIDEIGRRLDRVQVPERPDLDAKSKSSGSTVGDAVRDSFLNMGNNAPLSGRESPG